MPTTLPTPYTPLCLGPGADLRQALEALVAPGDDTGCFVIAGPDGAVLGGHVVAGNRVRTTAELLLVRVPGWRLSRAPDAATGYDELVVTRLDG